MGRELAPWLEFDFGDKIGIRSFRDREEALDFVQKEFDFYQWVSNYQTESPFSAVAQFVFNSTHHSVYGLNNPHQYGDGVSFLRNQFASLYENETLPLSFSAIGLFIADLRKSHGDRTAMGALAYIVKVMGGVFTSAEGAAGVMSAYAREHGHNRDAARSIQKNLDKLLSLMSGKIDDLEKARVIQAENARDRVRDQIKKNDIQKKWDLRRLKKALIEQERKFNEAVAEFSDVKKTYLEFMKLKAPVDYWTEKASQHRASSNRYRKTLIDYGLWVAPLLLLLLILIAVISYFAADPAKPLVAQLVFAAVGILVTTIAFWAARIVVRLYMSEHHLAIDAEERATMAMTYLALIERGAADEKDRALILAPLFRPTSDGIVKDDAAPEFSPAAIASRLLTPR